MLIHERWALTARALRVFTIEQNLQDEYVRHRRNPRRANIYNFVHARMNVLRQGIRYAFLDTIQRKRRLAVLVVINKWIHQRHAFPELRLLVSDYF